MKWDGGQGEAFQGIGICLCQGIWVAFQEGRLEQRKGWRGKYSSWWAGVRLEGAGKVWLRWAVLSRPWGPRAMNSILESDRLARILNLPLPECATCLRHSRLMNLFPWPAQIRDGEWIHVYVWLNPFAVHLKLSQPNRLYPRYKMLLVF